VQGALNQPSPSSAHVPALGLLSDALAKLFNEESTNRFDDETQNQIDELHSAQ
jgi:hypothetical protein